MIHMLDLTAESHLVNVYGREVVERMLDKIADRQRETREYAESIIDGAREQGVELFQ